jgi:predicted membrane metal-binding protein
MNAKQQKSDATHEWLSHDEAIQGSSDRSFGIVFAVVFAIVGLWPFLFGGLVRWWSLAIAAAFLAVALIRPEVLAPLNRLWTKFGLLLNRIVSPLVMGLLFFVVITPFALVMRFSGKDLLNLKHDPKAESYWILREPPGPSPETIKNQY